MGILWQEADAFHDTNLKKLRGKSLKRPYFSLIPYYMPVLHCIMSITKLRSTLALKQSLAMSLLGGPLSPVAGIQAHYRWLLMGKRETLPLGPEQEN